VKERKIRWWELLEQYNEEYRLRKQQGLSPSRGVGKLVVERHGER
jgi:hypothetical protein